MNCEDCGTRLVGGICSNCQEESYILENQSTELYDSLAGRPVSQEFADRAEEQRPQIKRNRERIRQARRREAERADI